MEEEDALTTRLCYVNFDGTKAIEASRSIDLDQDLDEDFVQTYCQQTVEAIEVSFSTYIYFNTFYFSAVGSCDQTSTQLLINAFFGAIESCHECRHD